MKKSFLLLLLVASGVFAQSHAGQSTTKMTLSVTVVSSCSYRVVGGEVQSVCPPNTSQAVKDNHQRVMAQATSTERVTNPDGSQTIITTIEY